MIHLACQIRLANIVCMWLFTFSVVLFYFVLFLLPEAVEQIDTKNDKDDQTIKKLDV